MLFLVTVFVSCSAHHNMRFGCDTALLDDHCGIRLKSTYERKQEHLETLKRYVVCFDSS